MLTKWRTMLIITMIITTMITNNNIRDNNIDDSNVNDTIVIITMLMVIIQMIEDVDYSIEMSILTIDMMIPMGTHNKILKKS